MAKKPQIQKIYPLSHMQQGMLFHWLLNKNDGMYFQQLSFNIHGAIDIGAFEKSFNMLIEKHDVFRTVIIHEKVNKPQQVVLTEREAKIRFEDISELGESEKASYINEFKDRDKQAGFDLSRDILIRLTVLKLNEATFHVIWSFHHIIMDGWCLGIVIKEHLLNYRMLKENKPVESQKPQPYSGYIKWLESQNSEEALEYWKHYLLGYEQTVELPHKKEQAENKKYVAERTEFILDREITNGFAYIARNCKVTINTVFQALWGILLQRYNNTDDVAFGTVVSGRPVEIDGIETMVGLFINTVPVRVKCDDNMPFAELVKELQKSALATEKFHYVSMQDIQQNIGLKHGLVNHIVTFENYPLEKEISKLGSSQDIYGFTISGADMNEQTDYDLEIMVLPGEELVVRIPYNASVYDRNFINMIEGHFKEAAKAVISNPDIYAGDIAILTERERNQILNDFCGKRVEYPYNKTVYQFIEKNAKESPDSIAVIYGDEKISCGQLNYNANRLARFLVKNGIKQESLVMVMLERSPLMIECILAIWKAGGAYIPIDINYPVQRTAGILEDSGAKFILTESGYAASELEEKCAGKIIKLDSVKSSIEQESGQNLDLSIDTGSLAYVIYTSGSTGKPKGAMVEHVGMMNHIFAKINDLGVTKSSIISQNASHCFDISVWQFFCAQVVGGKTVIYPNHLTLNPEKLIKGLLKDQVTILEVVPSFLSVMLDYLKEAQIEFDVLEYILVTGETVKPNLVKEWFGIYPLIKMVNAYGPTEASDDITHYIMDKAPLTESVSIGHAIQNFNIYIVDRAMNLCPVGVKGEICVSGIGVGRGYLNDPKKTNDAFSEDPFKGSSGVRLYRTGDLGCWLPDGNIEFFGRKDYQVKIRGFRIELGEIESKLTAHPRIREAVVIHRQDGGGSKYLCAYFVSDEELSTAEIKRFLLESLPDYMVPAYFIPMEKLPLTPNGKVNRKELPEPEENIDTGAAYQAPRNETEKKLAEIWQEVLGIEQIGIDDDFFSLGGDSIKTIQIASRLRKYGLIIDVRDIFEHSVIRDLSAYVRSASRQINQGTVEGKAVLTPIQQWFFEQNFSDMHHWNQSLMLYNREGFDQDVVEKVFTRIIEHHDALRMVYEIDGQKIVQINRGIGGRLFELKVADLKEQENYEERVRQEADSLQHSIDLSTGPLVKLGLFKTVHGDHLLVVIHHLVVDGISWRILLEDFAEGYVQAKETREIKFADKTDSYRDWADKLKEYAAGNEILKEAEYWNKIGSTDVQLLPKDSEININRVEDSVNLKLVLPEKETGQLLRDVNKAYNTDINDILVTALGMSVKEWAGIDRILVSMEGHGREEIFEDIDIKRTVGWFTAEYPVLLDMSKYDTLPYQIKNIKESLRRVPNKGIGYGILKYAASAENRKALKFDCKPEIIFNYMGQFDQDINNPVFEISKLPDGQKISGNSERAHILEIDGGIAGGKLELTFAYNKMQYKEQSIQKLIDNYEEKLKELINHCVSRENTEMTPADMGNLRLTLEEFDSIVAYTGKEIEGIYSLSPMQEGMLFYSMFNKGESTYFQQFSFRINGSIDVKLFEKSFNILLDRYDVFRTVFIYENLEKPQQVVFKKRNAGIHFEDITGLSEEEKNSHVEVFRTNDRLRGFDLSKDTLVRLSILRTGEGTYNVVWSFHHIIMDGWCLGIIIREHIEIYQSLKYNKPYSLETAQPYRNYIGWLEAQKKEEPMEYWKKYLEGYENQALLARHGRIPEKGKYELAELNFAIDEGVTQKLLNAAKENQVTLNTVFQTIWGILLQKQNDIDDVVFGSVVSGRPHELPDVEKMVGLFINTIPVRVKGGEGRTFAAMLKEFQEYAILSERNGYFPLAKIQANSQLKHELIDHIVIFENYPMGEELENKTLFEFEISDLKAFEQTNYNFNVIVIPGNRIKVSIRYNSLAFDREFVEDMETRFKELMERVVDNPALRIDEMDILLNCSSLLKAESIAEDDGDFGF